MLRMCNLIIEHSTLGKTNNLDRHPIDRHPIDRLMRLERLHVAHLDLSFNSKKRSTWFKK